MDKIKRMLLKVKQQQEQTQNNNFIAWATVFPMRDEYELNIMYAADKDNDTLQREFMFKTAAEADEHVDALAKEHGQEEVMVIHFMPDPHGAE
jgi:uncharacterized Rmd1/YagE family protein